jgi:hypothetical protein
MEFQDGTQQFCLRRRQMLPHHILHQAIGHITTPLGPKGLHDRLVPVEKAFPQSFHIVEQQRDRGVAQTPNRIALPLAAHILSAIHQQRGIHRLHLGVNLLHEDGFQFLKAAVGLHPQDEGMIELRQKHQLFVCRIATIHIAAQFIELAQHGLGSWTIPLG